MSGRGTFRVAAVQATPSYLDREGTLDIVVEHVLAAGADGSDLVVLPESFVPGYPDWVWRRKPWDDADWYARFADQAVDLSGPVLEKVCAAAASAEVAVALGVTERTASGTLYNAVVHIASSGVVAGLHRKLVPTGGERLVWATGQGPVVTVVDVGGVRVGTLICWEVYMPLARAALYQQGVDVVIAPTWDNSEAWVPTLRTIAKEGQVFVVGATAFLRGCDVPRDLPGADDIYGGAEDFMSRGNSTIVAPGGGLLAGPLVDEAGTVSATLDLDRIAAGRRMFDPVGHYARPDVFTLTIHRGGVPT